MALALRLGRTLHELQVTMTASELAMWIEYDAISPISDRRGDFHAAQISSAIYQAHGNKVSMEEMLLQWQETEPGEDTQGLEMFFESLMG
ncbi:phage tail assembly protein T [Yersinia pseudotuberculosis]|uniref:phage tail assembly protein T n=1 Tax=Yersinia pseudotuberculosis TaxID=633 RepID=UPI00067DDF43|nr:DUF4035 domain-containing protein [Yersinia pseudotuberculosis]